MNAELNYIHKEVKALLEAFGYEPKTKIGKSGNCFVDIYFHVDGGFDAMPTRHKDAISMLAKGYLYEFYYGCDTQHVYLRDKYKGLNPNDDRYSCLIHQMRLVEDDLLPDKGVEVFVNMGDHFKRFVNWQNVSSIE